MPLRPVAGCASAAAATPAACVRRRLAGVEGLQRLPFRILQGLSGNRCVVPGRATPGRSPPCCALDRCASPAPAAPSAPCSRGLRISQQGSPCLVATPRAPFSCADLAPAAAAGTPLGHRLWPWAAGGGRAPGEVSDGALPSSPFRVAQVAVGVVGRCGAAVAAATCRRDDPARLLLCGRPVAASIASCGLRRVVASSCQNLSPVQQTCSACAPGVAQRKPDTWPTCRESNSARRRLQSKLYALFAFADLFRRKAMPFGGSASDAVDAARCGADALLRLDGGNGAGHAFALSCSGGAARPRAFRRRSGCFFAGLLGALGTGAVACCFGLECAEAHLWRASAAVFGRRALFGASFFCVQ